MRNRILCPRGIFEGELRCGLVLCPLWCGQVELYAVFSPVFNLLQEAFRATRTAALVEKVGQQIDMSRTPWSTRICVAQGVVYASSRRWGSEQTSITRSLTLTERQREHAQEYHL